MSFFHSRSKLDPARFAGADPPLGDFIWHRDLKLRRWDIVMARS